MTLSKWRKPTENGYENNAIVYASPLSGLLQNFFGDDFLSREHASFVPAVNISEEVEQYNLELSAPGFEKEEFKIEVDKGALLVSGKHKTEKESKEKNFTRKEFNYGSFQRSFSLPEEVNENAIVAKYENGILKIQLPKKEESKQVTREIRIV